MYYLLTNDVEEHSIQKNKLDDDTAQRVSDSGLPRLLDIYKKHEIRATFYFTGTFVEKFPDSTKVVKAAGHEIGCHGYSHDINRGLDKLSYDEQLSEIKRAKQLIEKEVGEVKSFRSPALRINADTIKILEDLGFETDSSVAPQRFDGPLSFGWRKKINWLFANRKPYFVHHNNPYKKGNSNILEIPISAFIFPHIGTMMRLLPEIDVLLRYLLFYESKETDKPVVFLMHPTECIFENKKYKIQRRADNVVSYFFADYLRSHLKVRNLGCKAIELLEKEIICAKSKGFEFVTCSEYRRIFTRSYHEK